MSGLGWWDDRGVNHYMHIDISSHPSIYTYTYTYIYSSPLTRNPNSARMRFVSSTEQDNSPLDSLTWARGKAVVAAPACVGVGVGNG